MRLKGVGVSVVLEPAVKYGYKVKVGFGNENGVNIVPLKNEFLEPSDLKASIEDENGYLEIVSFPFMGRSVIKIIADEHGALKNLPLRGVIGDNPIHGAFTIVGSEVAEGDILYSGLSLVQLFDILEALKIPA